MPPRSELHGRVGRLGRAEPQVVRGFPSYPQGLSGSLTCLQFRGGSASGIGDRARRAAVRGRPSQTVRWLVSPGSRPHRCLLPLPAPRPRHLLCLSCTHTYRRFYWLTFCPSVRPSPEAGINDGRGLRCLQRALPSTLNQETLCQPGFNCPSQATSTRSVLTKCNQHDAQQCFVSSAVSSHLKSGLKFKVILRVTMQIR